MTAVAPSLVAPCLTPVEVRRSARTATALLAGLLVLVVTVSLSRSLFYPLGADQSFFRYITEMTMAGRYEAVDIHVRYAPAMVVLHWLAIVLFGPSAIGYRLFDACWQGLTLAALVSLGGRDRGRWATGWLAAVLYALAYYGMSYASVGTRDAFTVLPLLLMAHALLPASGGQRSVRRAIIGGVIAGVLGFITYLIKLPMGLGFGALWMYAFVHGWRQRRNGPGAFAEVIGLTLGFVVSAIACISALNIAGWWDGLQSLVTTYHPKGYTTGHWMMRDLAPTVFLAVVAIAIVLGAAARTDVRSSTGESRPAWLNNDMFSAVIVGGFAFGLLLTARSWSAWALGLEMGLGVYIPAAGALLIRPWRGSSAVRRIVILLALASLGSMFLQGKFWVYHFCPLMACCALLAADEIVERLQDFHSGSPAARSWAAACVAAVMLLVLNQWWPTMTAHSSSANVLAGTSLEQHYDRVAHRPTQVPGYRTTQAVARRVCDLTTEDDSIQCLYMDTRVYQMSQRSAAHHMLFPSCEGFDAWHGEYMRTIERLRPKVVLARLPSGVAAGADPATVASAVFVDIVRVYGPPGEVIRRCYRITEIIDDVCILQPVESRAGGQTE